MKHIKNLQYRACSKIFMRYFILSLIALNLFSCSSVDTREPSAVHVPDSEIQTEKMSSESDSPGSMKGVALKVVPKSNDASESVIVPSNNNDYTLGPEDLVQIEVFEVDELNRTARISSSGYIKLPLAGDIKAAGLTVSELEKEICKGFEKYIQEPVVSVFIKEYRSQSITVLGGVSKPQIYNVIHQKTLLDMLSLAGGVTEDAGDICYIQRENETILLNIKELLNEGKLELNIPVFPGDVINIPKGGVVFVNGSVNSPGSFVMKGGVTITQAVAMAKGFRYEAVRSQVRIYRDTGKDMKDIININYDDILAEKAPDIVLKNKDVVIVPHSGPKKFFAGFVRTFRGVLSFGGGSVGAGVQ